MTVLASTAVTAVAAAVCLPSGMWLSASQFPPYSASQTFPADKAVQNYAPQFYQQPNYPTPNYQQSNGVRQTGIEIVPRGAEAGTQTIPSRRFVSPPEASNTSDSGISRAEQVRSANVAGRRGTLGSPIFNVAQPDRGDHPVIVQEIQNPETPRPSVPSVWESRSGHSGISNASLTGQQKTGQEPSAQQSSGYNYVDSSGVVSLPYAGYSRTTPPENLTRTPSNGHPAQPVTWRNEGGEQEIADTSGPPVQQVQSARPTSPVPAVPFKTEGFGSGSETQTPALPRQFGTVESHPSILLPEEECDVPGNPSISAPMPRSRSGYSAGIAPGTSGFRATVEADAPAWMDPYRGRTERLPNTVEPSPTPPPSVTMPRNYVAWWDDAVRQRAGIAPRTLAVDVTSLVQQALLYSPQVQVLQADPEITQQIVRQEEAAFDWRTFLDAKYDDLNDPIGNTLTTGNNANRFMDSHLYSTGGFKRRTDTGGEVRLAQQFGYQDNNSRFLLPNPQATSRLELSFRQPLMSKSGTVYNQSQIFLARIASNSTADETLADLQKHLYSVTEAYWKLYRARAEFFQKQKLLASSRKVLATLDGRNEVDTIPRQILRARAAVARAESRMQRAVTDIRNAESQLRLLVNDPEMLNNGPVEFTPTETPGMMESPIGLRQSLDEALINRPDISLAIRQMRATGVRMGVSKSEMLPKLDFIVSTYVAGLEKNAQFTRSFTDQFDTGRPGYTVGMEFEIPLGNRAARAKVEQRQWELKRAISNFRATVEVSLTEVEIASREVNTSWRELLGKYEAMVAAQNEVSYLQDRFDVLPMVEESSMLLLEDLLDGFERLADEEAAFAQSQMNYALSIIQLRRATGTMLRSRHDEPNLDATEADWMSSRVEQAASDAESKMARDFRLPGGNPSTVSANDQPSMRPATWSRPEWRPTVEIPRTSELRTGELPPGDSGTATPLPLPRRIGGHSFGNGY